MDLSARDMERAKFTFSIYDFLGNDTIDSYNLGDALRALDLNPSLKLIKKLGGTTRKGEKLLSLEEFLPIYSDAKKDKDCGQLEDFVECLKLYDKDENGHMLANQLHHILLSYGEKMDTSDAEFILKDCSEAPDDDGLIKYIPFLKRVVGGSEGALTLGGRMNSTVALTQEEGMLFDRVPAASFSVVNKPLIVAVSEPDEEEAAPAASFTLKAPKKG